MINMYKEIVLEELLAARDLAYQKFMSKLLPGINNIIGVRVPDLRKISKKLQKNFWQEYLTETIHDSNQYHEETLIQGLVIATAKMSLEERLHLIQAYIPKLNNWAQCDMFCSSLKEVKKYPKEYWSLATSYCQASTTYKLRFGIVMLLTYYTNEEYAHMALNMLKSIKSDDYYVNMAIAWAISIFYIKQPQLTLPVLCNNNLNDFTHNKSIQKICESLRVSQKEKAYIKTFKL